MARPYFGNWACQIVRRGMDRGATVQEIANELATAPEFHQALQDGIDADQPIPGGDGAEQAVGNLMEAFGQPSEGF